MWIYNSVFGAAAAPPPEAISNMGKPKVQKIIARDEFTTAIQNQQELTIIVFHSPDHASDREVMQKLDEITQHYILHIFTVDTSTPTGLDIARAAGAAKVTPTFMLFRDESLLMKVQGERYMDLDRGVGSFA